MLKRQGQSSGRRWLIALFLYLGMIFVLSSIPGTALQKLGFSIWDKAAHALEYLPVGFFIGSWLIARTRHPLWPMSRVTMFAFAVLIAAGGTDEIHQLFVPARNASVIDLFADLIGGIAGLAVAELYFRIRRRRQAQLPVSQ